MGIVVVRKSMISGTVHEWEMDITNEQLDNYYKGGLLIQDAFPNLSSAEREFIKTGITPDEWNETFKDEE